MVLRKVQSEFKRATSHILDHCHFLRECGARRVLASDIDATDTYASMALGRTAFSLSARLMSTNAVAAERVGPTLYQTLASLPNNGVGAQVSQRRWAAKGIEGSYWEVTKVKLKNEGRNGKAWGKLVWRGKSTLRVECCHDFAKHYPHTQARR